MYRRYNEDYYICEFDIPILVAIKHVGKGVYNEFDYNVVEVTEFAIPVSEIKVEYMVSRELDQEHRGYIQSRKGDFKCNN